MAEKGADSIDDKRKEMRESSMRESSLGVLSTDRISGMSENLDLPSLRMSFERGTGPTSLPAGDSKSFKFKLFKLFKVPAAPKNKVAHLGAQSNEYHDRLLLDSERRKAQDILSRTKVVINREVQPASLAGNSSTFSLKDLLKVDLSPKTPRPFVDELGSLSLEDATATPQTLQKEDERSSQFCFPVRSASGAMDLFKEDEAALKAKSEPSHDSNLSHFSDTIRADSNGSRPNAPHAMESIGEFFTNRSYDIDTIIGESSMKSESESTSKLSSTTNKEPVGKSSMESPSVSFIRRMLADSQLTNTAIAGELLSKRAPSLSGQVKSKRDWLVVKSPIEASAIVRTSTTVSLPVKTQDRWLTITLIQIELATEGSVFRLSQSEGTWVKPDLLSIRCKKNALPPNHEHSIEVVIMCEKALIASILLRLLVNDIISEETQEASAVINLVVGPCKNSFSLSPKKHFFGTLPIGCHIDHPFTVSQMSSGKSNILVSMVERNKSFQFLDDIKVEGEKTKVSWGENMFEVTLHGRQTLEFFVRFNAEHTKDIEAAQLLELKDCLAVNLKTDPNGFETVGRCDISGEVAFAKFLPDCDFPPIVFSTPRKVPFLMSFHLTGVGSIPVKVLLKILTGSKLETLDDSGLFVAPKMITVPVNDSASIDVTFLATCREAFVRRFLCLQIEPNGPKSYIHLIGCFCDGSDDEGRSSRSSVRSGSTALSTCDPIPIKLSSSTNALSWAATGLQDASVQTFDIRLKSQIPVTARIHFSDNAGAFKLINEKCEAEDKCRKVLKPNTTTTLQILFKPQTIGLTCSLLSIEFNNANAPCQVPLTAFGGCAELRVSGTDSDVYGNKMVKLTHPARGSYLYTATFNITNYGNVEGFIHIKTLSPVISAAQSLKVYPTEATIEPNATQLISVSRQLTRDEVQDITSQQDIKKVATLSITMGDEPSRQRLRKFLYHAGGLTGGEVDQFVTLFPCKKPMDLSACKESKEFEKIFLKSVKSMEILVVLQKDETGNAELTAFELDDSKYFTSLCDTILVQPDETGNAELTAFELDNSEFFTSLYDTILVQPDETGNAELTAFELDDSEFFTSLYDTILVQPTQSDRQAYIRNFLTKGTRKDGRGLDDFRIAAVNVKSFTHTEGSSVVSLGDTKVVCGIKAELAKPKAEAPNEGYLVVNLELQPICSTKYPSGPPSDEAQQASALVSRSLLSTNIVNRAELCISPDNLAWVLYVDLICLNQDGGLIDAAVCAASAALRTTTLPRVEYDVDTEEKIVYENERRPLPINSSVFASTFAIYDGDYILQDPSAEEESLATGVATVVVCTKPEGSVAVPLYIPASKPLSVLELATLKSAAKKRVDNLHKLIEKAISTPK